MKIYSLENKTSSIEEFANELKKKHKNLVAVKDLITFLSSLGPVLLKKNPEIPGIGFVSQWLSANHLTEMIIENLGSTEVLDRFSLSGRKLIRAQPRGLVIHWIAGNVPTLGFFSLILSILAKNSNILRLPKKSLEIMKNLLLTFAEHTVILENGHSLSGSDILKGVGLTSLPSDDIESQKKLSLQADARVIWGGEIMVKDLRSHPVKSYCEDIIFGPKYSFSIAEDPSERTLKKFALDVVFSEQKSCASPHVIFIKSKDFMNHAKIFSQQLNNIKIPADDISYSNASIIYSKRAEFALKEDSDVICPKGTTWTILINKKIQLEEPIGERTVFLKPIKNASECLRLINRRVQTIGLSLKNKDDIMKFSESATSLGASRIVQPGTMNNFSSPWDGMYPLQRLVTWSVLKNECYNPGP